MRKVTGQPISAGRMTNEPGRQSEAKQAERAFERLAEPLRRELKLHCYRMLGSLHEAEDLVQETFLRAWRSFDRFAAGGSFRAWLYRIATNACLDALAARRSVRRLLPDRMSLAAAGMPDGGPSPDLAWLEPYPDAEIEAVADGALSPEARLVLHQSVRLGFIALLQELPPRQRAALLLRDVLDWSATEIAALIGGTAASINSALQRARETLARRHPMGQPILLQPPTPAQQQVLGRYLDAWQRLDLDSLVAVLKEDAIYTMPPVLQWYAGREAVRGFFAWAWKAYCGYRVLPTGANGQPAFAAYAQHRPGEPWRAHSLHVLEFEGDAIARLTLFTKPVGPGLFQAFDFPLVLGGDAAAKPASFSDR